MEKAKGLVIVLTTVPTKLEARLIMRYLIDNKLAACAAVIDATSLYKWKGELKEQKEYQMIIKTTRKSLDKLEKVVRKYHSYSVPELLVLPVEKGGKDYVEWVRRGGG
jgi:periplasmic divalent cation tolerance protein